MFLHCFFLAPSITFSACLHVKQVYRSYAECVLMNPGLPKPIEDLSALLSYRDGLNCFIYYIIVWVKINEISMKASSKL